MTPLTFLAHFRLIFLTLFAFIYDRTKIYTFFKNRFKIYTCILFKNRTEISNILSMVDGLIITLGAWVRALRGLVTGCPGIPRNADSQPDFACSDATSVRLRMRFVLQAVSLTVPKDLLQEHLTPKRRRTVSKEKSENTNGTLLCIVCKNTLKYQDNVLNSPMI